MTNKENPNYTIENFEKWLNADSSRKAGLWLWVKAEPDLFASLATGKDQGGWNISDPKFRTYYGFEEYYQVFCQWKKAVDAQENGEENWETDSNVSSDTFYSLDEDLLQEILTNLEKVCFYDEKGIYYLNSTYYNVEEKNLQKIKREFIDQVIKKNPSEWSIKEEPKTILVGLNIRGKVPLLVHNSAQIERGFFGGLKIDSGKIHYKKAFTEEEWTEITDILNNYKQKQPNQQENNNKNGWTKKQIFTYGGLGIGGIVLIILAYKWIMRKIN